MSIARIEEDLDRARIRLLLDRDAAAKVSPVFENVRMTFNGIGRLVSDKRQGEPGISWPEIEDKQRDLDLGVEALHQVMVDSLAQLDRTIDELAAEMTPAKKGTKPQTR